MTDRTPRIASAAPTVRAPGLARALAARASAARAPAPRVLAARALAARALAAAMLLAVVSPVSPATAAGTTGTAAHATARPVEVSSPGGRSVPPPGLPLSSAVPPRTEPPPTGPPSDARPPTAPPPDASAPPSDAGVPPSGAGVPAPGARYAWPLHPAPEVHTPFRAPAHPFGPGHRGVDLAGTVGQPVLAARGGVVVFAGPVAGRPVVSVQHDDGLRTTYEPVHPSVTTGDVVATGAVLGRLEPGHAGCPPAPAGTGGACLHWGVRRDRTEYLDPLVLLRPARVRLLPVPDPWPG